MKAAGLGLGTLGLAACSEDPTKKIEVVATATERIIYQATVTPTGTPEPTRTLAPEPTLTPTPVEISQLIGTGGEYTEKQNALIAAGELKQQEEINQVIIDFWTKGKARNEDGTVGTLFANGTSELAATPLFDPEKPEDPKAAVIVLENRQDPKFLNGSKFTLPSVYVNRIRELDPKKLESELDGILSANNGFIPEGYGPLPVSGVTAKDGKLVRRDEKGQLVEVIGDNGQWKPPSEEELHPGWTEVLSSYIPKWESKEYDKNEPIYKFLGVTDGKLVSKEPITDKDGNLLGLGYGCKMYYRDDEGKLVSIIRPMLVDYGDGSWWSWSVGEIGNGRAKKIIEETPRWIGAKNEGEVVIAVVTDDVEMLNKDRKKSNRNFGPRIQIISGGLIW